MGVDVKLIQLASEAREFPEDQGDTYALVDAGLLDQVPPISHKGKESALPNVKNTHISCPAGNFTR